MHCEEESFSLYLDRGRYVALLRYHKVEDHHHVLHLYYGNLSQDCV